MTERVFPIAVDLDSAVPIYAQVDRQVRVLLARAYWRAGDQLPSVRELAVRLRINPLTVVKVYRLLRDDGLVTTRPGAGIFVSEKPAPKSRDRVRIARESLERAVEEAASLGLEEEAIREAFESSMAEIRKRVAPVSRRD
jgi:GntR family transcriptional regulator